MCLMSPVGIAWTRALKQAPNIKLYQENSNNPSAHGSYLMAACIFTTVFQRSPVGIKQSGLKGITKEEALILQSIAYRTVMDYQKYIMKKAKKVKEAAKQK